MMGVSFVIPVRNGGRWLDSVLTSIRAQTWPGPFEIIAKNRRKPTYSPELLLTLIKPQ